MTTTSRDHADRVVGLLLTASDLCVVEAKGARDTKEARKKRIAEAVDEILLAARLQDEESTR